MAIDRNAALKTAEKLLRQGKLEGAIQEYVRLVAEQPRDWNSVNALGDLYVRAGNVEQALAQFTRIADHLYHEGFFSKAAALYKKALKAQADHDASLQRLGEISIRLGLSADARHYLGHLANLRRQRGDARGAAECLLSLGALDDPSLKLTAARAALELGDRARAALLFRSAAEGFDKAGLSQDTLDARVEAAQLDPDDTALRAVIIAECLAAGDSERAARFLTRESAGDDPELLLALARIELARDRSDDARAALGRLLALAPQRSDDVCRLAEGLAGQGQVDAAFGCLDVVVEMAFIGGDLEAAIDALQRFLMHRSHIPAWLKLVEVAVDAGRDDVVRDAQGGLADAFLEAGRGAEARAVAEDLVAGDPTREENLDRLRRALSAVDAPDADAVLARYIDASPVLLDSLTFDDEMPALDAVSSALPDGLDDDLLNLLDDQTPSSASEPPDPSERLGTPRQTEDRITLSAAEFDLGDILSGVDAVPRPAAMPAKSVAPAPPPRDLDDVFATLRARVREQDDTAPAVQLERGLDHLQHGRSAEAIIELEAAARTPMLRCKAAASLGRLYASLGEMPEAVEWFERAADAPSPSADDHVAVLYELADALERTGEGARALAILIEIDGESAAYRDVPQRIEQLTRAQAGSPGR